jgi:hypothetical protein
VEAYGHQELPIVLAYQAAMNQWHAEDTNCAVVLEFDVSGLQPYPHWLAGALYQEVAEALLKELLEEGDIIQAIGARDAEKLSDRLYRFAESTRQGIEGYQEGRATSWLREAENSVDPAGPWGSANVAEVLSEMDPDELLALFVEAGHTGALPLEPFIKYVDAFTYLEPIDPSRVIRVTAFRPVRDELAEPDSWDTDPDVEEDEGPEVYSVEAFDYADFIPKGVDIWESPHGSAGLITQLVPTDMVGARAALPHLAEYLSCPWPYTQE